MSLITKTKSHTVHGKKLHCNACHVSGSMTCYNCHFSQFLKTKKKKGNFIPGKKKWLMLVNYEGQVTSGTVQTVVYEDKKFIEYAPYFTHSVMKNARKCDCCHSNAAMKLIEKGQNVPVPKFKNNKMLEWNGVFPYVTDKLDWVFLDKVDGKWVEMKNDNPVHVQNVGLAEPLNEKQVKSLIKSYK